MRKKATVVEVLKDSARVELENGLVMSVAADRYLHNDLILLGKGYEI